VGRTLAASLFPAIAIAAAWLGLEDPRRVREAAALVLLAVVPALVPRGVGRVAAAGASALAATWIVFEAQPWELLPFRDERVVSPILEVIAQGVVDFYAVFLPFEPGRNIEMHSLVLCGVFGFTLAVALLVASRRPIAAAAVTIAGVGWPATLLDEEAIAYGTVALTAALSIPLVLRASSVRTLAAGTALGLIVVVGAASASSATTLARDAVLDWETWDIRGATPPPPSFRFAWESNYDALEFPPEKTVVFVVKGSEEKRYWRASTLNLFTDEHWFEHLLWLGRVEGGSAARLAPGQLTPVRLSQRRNWDELAQGRPASDRAGWIEQEVEIEAYADDHIVAAGTPLAIDARRLGTVFQLSGNVLRARDRLRSGQEYRVWSYAPDPYPAELAASPGRYPAAAARYLEVDGREFPAFGTSERDRRVEEFFADQSYAAFRRYRPMYDIAQRVTRDARTPYETVLALESWFRYRGGFRYDESPPRLKRSPLVGFVTRTKAGFCQHFAGAMAAMTRMLGVPARVAVGFTSGTRRDDEMWEVTDHDAHAWVEVWFKGHGWIPFDPTPGRGTFATTYSFASSSNAAVDALSRGRLGKATGSRSAELPADLPRDLPGASSDRAPSLVAIALLLASVWIVFVGLGKKAVRRVRYVTRDPRRIATASRRELEGFLRDQGVEVPANATLVELQRAVHTELGLDGRAFAIAAARARFGPPDTIHQGAVAARRELRALIRAARRELSLWARFRGFISLRSVRAAGGPS
jgi:protein-glutamine gamma-glutamyltransferase